MFAVVCRRAQVPDAIGLLVGWDSQLATRRQAEQLYHRPLQPN